MKKHKIALLLSAPLALGVGAPAALASPPHVVDPSTVTPALNADFAPWTCIETGQGIRCTGTAEQRYTNEQTDISCDGRPVYVTGSLTAKTVRWHDAGGRALRTSLETSFSDRLTLSPTGAEGASAIFSGHWHKHYVYPEPGELDSRVLRETGAIYRLQSAGTGILLRDAGTVTFEPGQDYEAVAQSHGVHQVYDGSADVDQAICGALA